MVIYKTKLFSKWQNKSSELDDNALVQAMEELSKGLFKANLGGNIYKKRVAKKGFGKRSSYRTIIATNLNDRWIFIFRFAKNEKDNINQTELKAIQRYAELLMSYTNSEIEHAVLKQEIVEVNYENK